MSRVIERTIEVAGGPCRVLEAGEGPRVGVVAGHGGMPRWTPFLDRLARSRRVVLLSPPGFPGSGAQYEGLDGHIDWMVATLDLLEGADLAGCDLIASSIAGVLAADVATLAPGFLRSLSLAGPYGLFVAEDPVKDFFSHTPSETPGLLCKHADRLAAAFGEPSEADQIVDWRMMQYRAASAAARLVWPFGDRGLAKRLHRIRVPVQLIWGAEDILVPPSYAARFAAGLTSKVERVVIEDAAHLVWIDQPEASADAILSFLDGLSRQPAARAEAALA